jgi:hypothetical protein
VHAEGERRGPELFESTSVELQGNPGDGYEYHVLGTGRLASGDASRNRQFLRKRGGFSFQAVGVEVIHEC